MENIDSEETPQPKDNALLYVGIVLTIIILLMGYLTFFTDDPEKLFTPATKPAIIDTAVKIKLPLQPLKKSVEMSDQEIQNKLTKFINAFYYDQNRGYFDPPSYFAKITQTFYNYHNLTLASVLDIHNKRLLNMRNLNQQWVPSSLEYNHEGTLLVATFDVKTKYFIPSTGRQESADLEIEMRINPEGKIVSLVELERVVTSSQETTPPYDSEQYKHPTVKNKLYDANTVNTPPEFIGDADALKHYIETNLKYPPLAKENQVEGKVYLSFIVEKNGGLSNIEVINGGGWKSLESKL